MSRSGVSILSSILMLAKARAGSTINDWKEASV